MELLKFIYIICFIFQVLSIILLWILFVPISETFKYEDLYCDIINERVDENFMNEFKKLFPQTYSCRDVSYVGLGFGLISFLIGIILFYILIAYIIIFSLKMKKNGFMLNMFILCIFVTSILFLIPMIFNYISLIPSKTSFDNPEKIFIFNETLNKRIEEKVKEILDRKFYAILGIVLISILISTTLIKIMILFLAKKKQNIDEKLLIDKSNEPIVLDK